jgi:GntR family transcriptional regulator
MSLNFNKEAPPLYSQIKKDIKRKIKNSEYKPGEKIPSEKELQEIFDVSRITVRKAVLELVEEGYLSRQRGIGTIVRRQKIEEKLSKVMTFTEEMQIRNIKPSTKLAKIEKLVPEHEIAEFMQLAEGVEVYRITRLRCADGEPIVLFITYLNPVLSLPLTDKSYYGSLYKLIKKTNNKEVRKAAEYIEAIIADDNLAEKLDVEIGSAILKTTRRGYADHENPLEYTECFYRADKYRYFVELNR